MEEAFSKGLQIAPGCGPRALHHMAAVDRDYNAQEGLDTNLRCIIRAQLAVDELVMPPRRHGSKQRTISIIDLHVRWGQTLTRGFSKCAIRGFS